MAIRTEEFIYVLPTSGAGTKKFNRTIEGVLLAYRLTYGAHDPNTIDVNGTIDSIPVFKRDNSNTTHYSQLGGSQEDGAGASADDTQGIPVVGQLSVHVTGGGNPGVVTTQLWWDDGA